MTRSTDHPIRVLIVDDHAVVRRGLHVIVQTEPGMRVVGTAANGAEAIERAAELNPDVILMDLMMPVMDGIEAIGHIRAGNGEARVLVLTSFAEGEQIFPAIRAGALGYLLKDSSPEELTDAIRDVYQGEPSLDSEVARKLMTGLVPHDDPQPPAESLTGREIDVLKLVARGLSNRRIAEELVISEGTVHTHVRNILTKLDLTNRTQAALYALRTGLSRLHDD